MRNVVLLLIFFLSLPAFARDVYKSVNADGVVIYSDTYVEGAERIRVRDSKSTTTAPAEQADQQEQGTAAAPGTGGYESLEVVQPENDATIRSNEGNVSVGLAVSPGLAQGHKVKIVVDGNELEGEMPTTQFALSNLNRGTHTLVTRIVDEAGNVLISSNPITFHLRQASILTP